MRPKLSVNLWETLRNSGQPPPWKCKLQLRHERTVCDVEIRAAGETTSVGGRAIYSNRAISFDLATIEGVTLGAT